MANGISTSWGKLRVNKADGWAATYPQKGNRDSEAVRDVREESSKGRGQIANGFEANEGVARGGWSGG